MNNELIAKAEELKKNITEAVSDIVNSEKLVAQINEHKDVLNVTLVGGGMNFSLSSVLTIDKRDEIRDRIIEEVVNSQRSKEQYLNQLLRPEPIKNANDYPVKEKFIEEATKFVPANKKSKLTDEEEKNVITKLLANGATVKEIAEEMELTTSNIYDRIKKYGIKKDDSRKKNVIPTPAPEKGKEEKLIKEFVREEVISLLKNKKTVQEIADGLGMSKKECYEQMKKAKIEPSIYYDR